LHTHFERRLDKFQSGAVLLARVQLREVSQRDAFNVPKQSIQKGAYAFELPDLGLCDRNLAPTIGRGVAPPDL
jgi:hypothetical protein